MKAQIVQIFQRFLVKPQFSRFYEHLFKISLRGLGILNSEGPAITGESWLFQSLKHYPIKIIVDAGANDGGYAQDILSYFPKAQYYGFEPNPETFKILQQNLSSLTQCHLYSQALSSQTGKINLYDFADEAPLKPTQPTSTLASVYRQVITDFHHQPVKKYIRPSISLDDFTHQEKINQINWLKIDTEGHEFAILKGATNLIKHQKIDLIQFEVNEMNVYSRVFIKDYLDLLKGYRLYRLLPSGVLSINPYRPLIHEVFGFQNLIAVTPTIASIFDSKVK